MSLEDNRGVTGPKGSELEDESTEPERGLLRRHSVGAVPGALRYLKDSLSSCGKIHIT